MDTLTIGKVAAAGGVNLETIRYYERRGLLARPPRRSSGYRAFPPDTVERVLFIKRAQALGFSLNEISELLALEVDPTTTCADVRAKALKKLDDIDTKLRALRSMKRALTRLVDACDGDGQVRECPILDSLEGKGAL